MSDEVRGVRLRDLYRDADGVLWEVYALCTEPTASLRPVTPTNDGQLHHSETHVIGCLNWKGRWADRRVARDE